MDEKEYIKLLAELFPSNYMNNKVNLIMLNNGGSDDSSYEEESEEETEESEESELDKISVDELKDLSNNMISLTNKIRNKRQNNKLKKEDIKIKINKIKSKNYEEFRQLIYLKNNNNHNYFKEITIKKQDKIIKELKKLNEKKEEIPLIFKLLDMNISQNTKKVVLKKINMINSINPNSGEYYKLDNWIQTFFSIPINKNSNLPVSIRDGYEKCSNYIEKCKNILDNAIYGMNDAKIQFMQLIGQWINNPDSIGTSIALKGPMGTGKTTLLKNGISKLLNREIAFIALGGASDGSFLEGHSYTYEGSTYGKIVDILIQCKTSNPIIYFDELDKVSDTPKGEEIIGILTHLTDTTQNTQFHDKYMSEIDIDMSKCLFIFSYNEEHKVNKILKDRMYVIETNGYNTKDKIIISHNFLIPTIEETLRLNKGDIIINDDILSYIIEKATNNEKGVRNLKRQLEIIYNRINLYRFLKKDSNFFNQKIIRNIKFPIHITRDIVDMLVVINKGSSLPLHMYL